MKKQLTKLALAASFGLALAFTACEEKEAAKASQESLEDAIIKTIKAFQNKDKGTLDKLVLNDFGIALVNMGGLYWRMNVYDKIPFDNIEGPALTPFGHKNFITDYNISFEELPFFDCREKTWSKPRGKIYCDTTQVGGIREGIARTENEYLGGTWARLDVDQFRAVEEKSYKIMAIGKEDGVFIFHLTFWQNEWFLTEIESFETCGGD